MPTAMIKGAAVLLAVTLFLFPDSLNAGKPSCGDGKCNGGENSSSCPVDCPAPPPDEICGNGVCAGDEDSYSCPADCGEPPPATCNNDGVCNDGEDCLACSDCAGRTDGKPKNRYCCGADTCDESRCGALCSAPVPECGDYIVDYDEECDDGPSGSASCSVFCETIATTAPVPLNQFNIGDSIGEAEAANGTIGSINHQAVWSTGWDSGDIVNTLNERFEFRDAAAYVENSSLIDGSVNQAVSGAVMADFAGQAAEVAAAMGAVDQGGADMVTILLGNNDVCASSLAAMTDPGDFEQQYRSGLDVLASSPFKDSLNVLVSGIPAIYWLWDAKRSDFWCRVFIWPNVPCENLLGGAANDCESNASALDPDRIYSGDGENCVRRKQFHARIRDIYNPILENVLQEYVTDGSLPNAEYVDIFDVKFGSEHVNGGDCFHPSKSGHALISSEQWCRSSWGAGGQECPP